MLSLIDSEIDVNGSAGLHYLQLQRLGKRRHHPDRASRPAPGYS